MRGGQFALGVPPLQSSSPLGTFRTRRPFLEKLLQPLQIFFYTVFLLQIIGRSEDMCWGAWQAFIILS